ncbi:frequency clock protein [Xylariaceae sp. FL1019]|nr:frequency clock protein [Xylariaceae sp. FL1019]
MKIMSDPKNTPVGTDRGKVTYVNPRRTSPENSITLRHHRLAHEASKQFAPTEIPNAHSSLKPNVKSPRRYSSGESHETGRSDPRRWFDQFNTNAVANTNAMDMDPPFYQKETDSSNEELHAMPTQSPAYRHVQSRGPVFRPGLTQNSSSTGDFRSVIDDLTIENKRLREELRKYKQMGPDSLKRDKLFEVKVHGLPSAQKRALEAALRDFTTHLEESSTAASKSRKKSSGKSKEGNSSASKHPSSSSGSNSRPVDSAYASGSTGLNSSSQSLLPGSSKAARIRNNENVENYLRDIPEGLWPRHGIMPEKDKKKLVVRRLEHLFTGKVGNTVQQAQYPSQPQPIVEDIEMGGVDSQELTPQGAAREATIRPRDKLARKTSHSRDTTTGSNTQSQSLERSHGDQTNSNSRDNSRDNASGSGSGHGSGSGGRSGNANTSPPTVEPAPEQRPTRPRDLDPDRKQVPSENMDYIRHLGLVAPESQSRFSARDVSPDADGWVYLNLLCNLAQLHILNVTPDFIRTAVTEKSTKFQLSPDGRKIRWRGGDEGTKFASDSSGTSSLRRQSSEDTDGSNDQDQRKKRKIQPAENDVITQKGSKFSLGVQDSNSSETFHYKPMFVHHQTSSSEEQPSAGDETGSSFGIDESNLGAVSRWNQSGVSTGVAQPPRKRRRDGAIIYYSGAPFCTDLSGDLGEVSPDTYGMTSSLCQQYNLVQRPYLTRTTSGSSIPYKPLSDFESYAAANDLDALDTPDMTSGETDDDDIEADFPWSNLNQQAFLTNFEASGLGGISPDDHFVVVVSTKRPKVATFDSDDDDDSSEDEMVTAMKRRSLERSSQDTTDSKTTTDTITGKLNSLSTESPVPIIAAKSRAPTAEIEYLHAKIRRLPPVPLPPPAFYCPSSGSDSDDEDSMDDEAYVSSERSVLSKRPMVEGSPGSDKELSGNDEEDEDSDEKLDFGSHNNLLYPGNRRLSGLEVGQESKMLPIPKVATGSSLATAGDAASGYNSSMEDA